MKNGILLAGVALLALTVAPIVHAQAAKTLTIITHSAPGGPADVLARAVGPGLTAALGSTVVVENRPGGSGKLGIQALLQAPRDGNTIFTISYTHLVTLPLAEANPGYDADRDFVLLSNGIGTPAAVAVHNSVPARTWAEFVPYAREKGEAINYGSFGIASAIHFGTESLLEAVGGLKLTHVPYRSEAQSLPDLVAGTLQFMIVSGAIKPHAESGAVRVLATTGTARWSQFPDKPTMHELGVNYEWIGWTGFAAAAGIPDARAKALQEALVRALTSDTVRDAFGKMGAFAMPGTPAEFQATVQRDRQLVSAALKSGRIKLKD